MGCKRPFDDEEFQELPFKQSRRLDYTDKLTQFSDSFHCNEAHQKPIVSVEGDEGLHHQSQRTEPFEKEIEREIQNLADKEFENSAPLSWVTNSSGDDDAVSGTTTFSPLSPEYFECDIPQRKGLLVENVYLSLLNDLPKKSVRIGPSYQAELPEWDEHMNKIKLDKKEAPNPNNSFSVSATNEMFMGTCIIPMPDSFTSLENIDKAGVMTNGCNCLDEGSVRCARQHVKEARDKLMKSIGFEIFVRLGLYDMGEEVARKWTSEEERIFHEVVYANPARLGKDFWKCLPAVFPFRLHKEFVSYYFNVFILRRRAAQNRSNFLDIDSDDDEPLGIRRCPYNVRVLEEEEDSYIETESPVDQDDDEDDDNDDDDDDSCNGDGNVGNWSGDFAGEDSRVHHTPKPYVNSFNKDHANDMDPILMNSAAEYNVEDDSCMSFEMQSNTVDSYGPNDSTATQDNGFRANFDDGHDDLASQVYLFDFCVASDWDAKYLMGPMKDVDFLSTSNIIDEIFGQSSTPEIKKRSE